MKRTNEASEAKEKMSSGCNRGVKRLKTMERWL